MRMGARPWGFISTIDRTRQDNDTLLREACFDDDAIARLRQLGVIAESREAHALAEDVGHSAGP
jgi:hypothetical protein